jgi:hypothetical protein
MEEHVSTDFPRQTERNYEVTAEAKPARPVPVSDAPRPRKTRARIIQVVSIVLLVVVATGRRCRERAAVADAVAAVKRSP